MPERYKASWLTEEGRPAEVNQRALIPKVLARYPGEFTLFRELLQNSDDAQSSKVEIHFETAGPGEREVHSLAPPDPKTSDVVRWTFKNDGKPFTTQDWRRLARIAEGNPDPMKVGAFGVGFYCLFSVTDCPFVSSDGHGMQFYWKDGMDQLFVRQGSLPSEEGISPWTVFDIPLREPGHIPPDIEFMQFLATSITFMAHLKDVSVFFNQHRIGRIRKLPELTENVDLPITMECTSPGKILAVDGIRRHCFRIQAEISTDSSFTDTSKSYKNGELTSASLSRSSFDASTFPLPSINSARVYASELRLTVFTAEVDVKGNEKLSRELLRCTAKKPPSRVKYSLVYTDKGDYDLSLAGPEDPRLTSIFQGLRADLSTAPHPRIFIGHSTSQTTGIGGHMESAFIPTVERESIDLVNISIWNSELLYVGGFLSRVVYELELSAIHTLWEGATESRKPPESKLPQNFRDRLRDRFIHVLKFFTFRPSTPSPKVALALQRSFYACSALPLRLLSSVGVRSASDIKMFDPLCDKFLKHVPMLSPDVSDAGQIIIKALPDEHKIRAITHQDVLQELRVHTLDEGELVACLQWQVRRASTDGMAELLQVACFWRADGTTAQLSTIHNFINPDGLGAHIPLDGPLPPSLIPRNVARYFIPPESLVIFGWREFTIVDWVQHISLPETRSANPQYDFTKSIDWAERVLRSISLAWSSSDEIRRLAKSVFANEMCIPVMRGLCRPGDSYLPSLNIPAFDGLHLPVVCFPSSRAINVEMQQLLVALGVQQHLPPQLLLAQMVETGKWSTSDLIDYLVHVADTLSAMDISQLKSANAFAKEGVENELFRADELYPPLDSFRQLHLPLIEWGERSKWRDSSPQAELLYRLGLRRHPPLDVIINLCSSSDTVVRTNAFTYLCANLRSVYQDYNPDGVRDTAFIPAENMDGPRLEKLGNVFLDSQWKIFGFSVIRSMHLGWEHVIKELGVQRHPPSLSLLQLLKTAPPSNEEIARRWFEILSDHISSFAPPELDTLSQLRFVPKTISGNQDHLPPSLCYLGKSAKDDFYSKLFHFVNFGPLANRFLDACGAKNEPSENDIAESLLDDPERFYQLAGGRERFLKELRELALRHTRIPNDTLGKMRSSPILLGVRREKTMSTDGRENKYSLWKPSEIVIVDDIDAYQLFDDSLVIAPRDVAPELEQFYALLGCRHLSTVIRDKCNGSGELPHSKALSNFRAKVLQRLFLFLHHYPHPQAGTVASWSPSMDGISVRHWEYLSVSTTLTVESKKVTKERDVWATAKLEQGKIEVWLSRSAKKDMYEIAVSLCRVLFGTVNLSDALLLTTILSEDLDVLERRGYEVDQVLKRKQCHDAMSRCAMGPSSTATQETSDSPSIGIPGQDPTTETDLGTTASSRTTDSRWLGGSEAASVTLTSAVQLPLAVTNVVKNVRNAFRLVADSVASKAEGAQTGAPTTVLPPSPWAPRQVMPRSYIGSNVDRAIQACNARERMPRQRHDQTDVINFLNNGYCDVTAPIGNLRSVGKTENVEVFVGQGIPDADKFMERMCEPLSLFVRTIVPIAKVYDLSTDSIRVFYDTTAGCIAFNRKGVLYLNLRYFEAWHYQDVKKGDLQRAMSSWFLTLAHEIAHNLVSQHNSEHEFWFAAICESRLDKFAKLLDPAASVCPS